MPDQLTTTIAEVVKETIQAPHHFTEAEQLELGNRLVQSLINQDQIQRELDSVKQEFKARTEKAELETNVIRRKLGDGYEMRPTLAIVRFNSPEHGRKQFVRDDNGELIREEAMTMADMERPLFKNQNGQDATAPEPEATAEDVGDTDPSEIASGETTPKLELARLPIILDEPGWTASGLRTELRAKAKLAKWPEESIKFLLGVIDGYKGDLGRIKDALRPHVIALSED